MPSFLKLKTKNIGKFFLYQGTILLLGIVPVIAATGEQSQNQAKNEGDKPLFMPKRDVTVIYAVRPENSPMAQTRKIYFSGDGNRLRIDGPDNIGMTIVDSQKKEAIVTANKPRIYTIVPSKSDQSGLFFDPSMTFKKRGTKRVADVLCRQWDVKGPKGKATVCITDDGVLLQQDGTDADGTDGETTALSVDYASLPASTFQVPVGFQQVKLPQNKGNAPTLVAPNSASQPLMPVQAKSENQSDGVKVDTKDNPFTTPQRDVDVVYAIAGPMPGLPAFHQRMRWSVDQRKQRIDSQGIGTYMITDYNTKKLTVLNPDIKKKTTTPIPGDPVPPLGQRAYGDYMKVGEATVAGQHCNEWKMTDTEGNPNDICYTDDGVMLRVVRNNIPLVVALKVVYEQQPKALFDVPTNLQELAPAHP